MCSNAIFTVGREQGTFAQGIQLLSTYSRDHAVPCLPSLLSCQTAKKAEKFVLSVPRIPWSKLRSSLWSKPQLSASGACTEGKVGRRAGGSIVWPHTKS